MNDNSDFRSALDVPKGTSTQISGQQQGLCPLLARGYGRHDCATGICWGSVIFHLPVVWGEIGEVSSSSNINLIKHQKSNIIKHHYHYKSNINPSPLSLNQSKSQPFVFQPERSCFSTPSGSSSRKDSCQSMLAAAASIPARSALPSNQMVSCSITHRPIGFHVWYMYLDLVGISAKCILPIYIYIYYVYGHPPKHIIKYTIHGCYGLLFHQNMFYNRKTDGNDIPPGKETFKTKHVNFPLLC